MNAHDQERTAWDFLLFGLVFGGVMIALTGIAVTLPAVAILGLLLILFSLICFFLKQV